MSHKKPVTRFQAIIHDQFDDFILHESSKIYIVPIFYTTLSQLLL